MRDLPQAAAIRADAPNLIAWSALRVEIDEFSIGRPAAGTVSLGIIGELTDFTSIRSREEEIFLRSETREDEPFSIGRDVAPRKQECQQRAADDRRRLADHSQRDRIETDARDRLTDIEADVRQRPGIARESEMRRKSRRKRNRFGMTDRDSSMLIHRKSPHVHRAVAITAEIEILPVWRPDRIPVEGTIIRQLNDRLFRIGGVRIDREQIALSARSEDRPVRDAIAVRRPVRLESVLRRADDVASGTGSNIDNLDRRDDRA